MTEDGTPGFLPPDGDNIDTFEVDAAAIAEGVHGPPRASAPTPATPTAAVQTPVSATPPASSVASALTTGPLPDDDTGALGDQRWRHVFDGFVVSFIGVALVVFHASRGLDPTGGIGAGIAVIVAGGLICLFGRPRYPQSFTVYTGLAMIFALPAGAIIDEMVREPHGTEWVFVSGFECVVVLLICLTGMFRAPTIVTHRTATAAVLATFMAFSLMAAVLGAVGYGLGWFWLAWTAIGLTALAAVGLVPAAVVGVAAARTAATYKGFAVARLDDGASSGSLLRGSTARMQLPEARDVRPGGAALVAIAVVAGLFMVLAWAWVEPVGYDASIFQSEREARDNRAPDSRDNAAVILYEQLRMPPSDSAVSSQFFEFARNPADFTPGWRISEVEWKSVADVWDLARDCPYAGVVPGITWFDGSEQRITRSLQLRVLLALDNRQQMQQVIDDYLRTIVMLTVNATYESTELAARLSRNLALVVAGWMARGRGTITHDQLADLDTRISAAASRVRLDDIRISQLLEAEYLTRYPYGSPFDHDRTKRIVDDSSRWFDRSMRDRRRSVRLRWLEWELRDLLGNPVRSRGDYLRRASQIKSLAAPPDASIIERFRLVSPFSQHGPDGVSLEVPENPPRIVALLQMMRLLLAIEAHRMKHGALPADLKSLDDPGFAAEPVSVMDPMARQQITWSYAIRGKPVTATSFRVWSSEISSLEVIVHE